MLKLSLGAVRAQYGSTAVRQYSSTAVQPWLTGPDSGSGSQELQVVLSCPP